MYVFYDPATGAVSYTATGTDDLVKDRENWIEVPEQELGNLAAWRVVAEVLVLDAVAELQAQRAGMSCTRMQGILALGPVRWAAVMTYHDTATWAEQVIIDSASDWQRLSQNIQFFAYLLNLSATEVDDLFITAAGIEA
jgi:hypothetical protein